VVYFWPSDLETFRDGKSEGHSDLFKGTGSTSRTTFLFRSELPEAETGDRDDVETLDGGPEGFYFSHSLIDLFRKGWSEEKRGMERSSL